MCHGGKIHAIGGRGLNKATVATHEVYDPSTGKWSKAAPLPTARDHMGVIVADGRIHVIGGRTADNADNTNLHDVYDPTTNSWQSAAPLPIARSSGAAAYYHGLILYAGGECNQRRGTFSENEAYDPKTGKWLTLAPLPAGRHGFGAAWQRGNLPISQLAVWAAAVVARRISCWSSAYPDYTK